MKKFKKLEESDIVKLKDSEFSCISESSEGFRDKQKFLDFIDKQHEMNELNYYWLTLKVIGDKSYIRKLQHFIQACSSPLISNYASENDEINIIFDINNIHIHCNNIHDKKEMFYLHDYYLKSFDSKKKILILRKSFVGNLLIRII